MRDCALLLLSSTCICLHSCNVCSWRVGSGAAADLSVTLVSANTLAELLLLLPLPPVCGATLGRFIGWGTVSKEAVQLTRLVFAAGLRRGREESWALYEGHREGVTEGQGMTPAKRAR